MYEDFAGSFVSEVLRLINVTYFIDLLYMLLLIFVLLPVCLVHPLSGTHSALCFRSSYESECAEPLIVYCLF